MDSIKRNEFDELVECLESKKSFVLQGGAGSGKTETLKRVLEHISNTNPEKKIVCITHTNLAADEIKSRVGTDKYLISTIHSFLNSLIKNYKKSIHEVIFEIFRLDKVERKELSEYESEKEQKAQEHKKYKKIYSKFASRLYSVRGESSQAVVGKRDYDKHPERFNTGLNNAIDSLNAEIKAIIEASDHNKVAYNETRFDSFSDLTFGHDSLIKVSALLFDQFPTVSKILQDKFDYIFVDEYQDTSREVIDALINFVSTDDETVVGLFGDSMQGIYDDGIGNVQEYLSSGKIIKIEKENNYRCSEQVINFINEYRDDNLSQEVSLKTINGVLEEIGDRQGEVKLYYSIYEEPKPHSRSTLEDKEKYLNKLESLIAKVEEKHEGFKKLMLTNKSISSKVGFENLYQIFNDRYFDIKDEIEKCLTKIQLIDLVELCDAYKNKRYNLVLSKIRKAGFELRTYEDKGKVSEILGELSKSDKSAQEVLNLAFENKLLKKSDSYLAYIDRKNIFLKGLEEDEFYKTFKEKYDSGLNTFNRIKAEIEDIDSEEFDDYQRLYKREMFYLRMFSNDIKFDEIVKYYSYLNEETDYITMHKTKGSGIENVMVILDEYFWSKYNFSIIFDSSASDLDKKIYNQKLFYVACSRAIKNLICIKLINSGEEKDLVNAFPNYEKLTQ